MCHKNQSEQSVTIADLAAQAHIKQATGEVESTRLKASGEAEAIRATGTARADTYRAGVEALDGQNYTAMQLMQIIGDRHVRLIPDVLAGNTAGSNGLVDDLLSLILWNQTNGKVSESLDTALSSLPIAEVYPSVPAELPNGNGTANGTANSALSQ